jgi:cell division protein ZipA
LDATTLRIVLFVAGLVFLGGIYLYEIRRRKRESGQAHRRVAQKVDHNIQMQDEISELEAEPEAEPEPEYAPEYFEEPSLKHGEHDEITELLDDQDAEADVGSFRIDDEPIPGIDEPLPGNDEPYTEEDTEPVNETAMEQQDLFGFSAREESPVDVPDLIIQINVRAKKPPFDGPAIEKAMQETGLTLSEMSIYQRLASDGSHKVLFNVASMVEPGVFPLKTMADFSTPGLTLFTQLPGPGDSMMIFSDMLYTAERLAAMLVGDLQDETHSALSKQTIEHLRERILEQKRQIQLARRKG